MTGPEPMASHSLCYRILAACVLAGTFSPSAWPSAGDCDDIPGSLLDPPEGPFDASVTLILIDIQDVEDSSQRVTLDFALAWGWSVSRLASDGDLGWVQRCRLTNADVWLPNTQFVNGRELNVQSLGLNLAPDGRLSTLARVQGDFQIKMDLHDFPWDTQHIGVDLVVPLPASQLRLVPNALTRSAGDFSAAGWTFGEFNAVERAFVGPLSPTGIAGARFEIGATRSPAFYPWRIVLPLCLIVAMSWSVFWIRAEQLGAQLEVSSASVLTLIAFQLSFTDVLPQVSYLTRLDDFVLISTVLVFLALAESVVTSYLAFRNRSQLAERIDYGLRYVFPGVFALAMIVYLL
ncbi:MAG: hypothetical protein P8Y95_05890 [Gammaproteobacteria bacterium]